MPADELEITDDEWKPSTDDDSELVSDTGARDHRTIPRKSTKKHLQSFQH